MAYNTNTERLLNAIKSNTANITVTATSDNSGLETLVQAGNNTLTGIQTDTGNIDTSLNTIETNSNQSLGKNGSLIVTGATDIIGASGSPITSAFNIAVQFLEDTTISNYQVGTDAEQTSLAVVIPAGTIIYGDIRILVVSVAKNCILYKA